MDLLHPIPSVRLSAPPNRKRPAGGGGALLGLLQGGDWERGEAKPDLACPCGGMSGYLRLNPAEKVGDWRITGASEGIA